MRDAEELIVKIFGGPFGLILLVGDDPVSEKVKIVTSVEKRQILSSSFLKMRITM